MKKNKLTTLPKLQSMLNDFFDPFNWPEGTVYYNPYFKRWKRGRPSKDAIELRDWAAGWDLYFYELYPRHAPGNQMVRFLNMVKPTEKINKPKGSRTALVRYNQREHF